MFCLSTPDFVVFILLGVVKYTQVERIISQKRLRGGSLWFIVDGSG